MKTKQVRNESTGLTVRTTLKAGEDNVQCGCEEVRGKGWWCSGGNGKAQMEWSEEDVSSWIEKNCPVGRGPGSME